MTKQEITQSIMKLATAIAGKKNGALIIMAKFPDNEGDNNTADSATVMIGNPQNLINTVTTSIHQDGRIKSIVKASVQLHDRVKHN